MHIRKILLVAWAALSLPAAAEFTDVIAAYEVGVREFTAPVSLNGAVQFKQCAECDLQILRVTPETRYLINRKPVTLVEFRENFVRLRSRTDEEIVVVKHDLASDTVTAVSFTL